MAFGRRHRPVYSREESREKIQQSKAASDRHAQQRAYEIWQEHGQYDPNNNIWTDERNGQVIPTPENIHHSFTTQGVVNNIPSGAKLVQHNAPCPILGSEDGAIYFRGATGKKMFWIDGDLYER